MPDLRLALPAVALWVSCAVLIGLPSAAGIVALVSAVLAVGIIGAALVRRTGPLGAGARNPSPARRRLARRAPMIGTLLAAAALAATLVALHAPGRVSSALDAAADRFETTELDVRVERTPQRVAAGFDGASRWSLRGRTVGVPASVPVSVLFGAAEHEARLLAVGAVVRVEGTIVHDEPGEATSYTVRVPGDRPPTVSESPPFWLAWTAPIRTGFAEAASRTPGDGGALLPGLAIGDETAVSTGLDEAMKTSSLSHLTAVSGANCALVIALVFGLARMLGAGRRTRIVSALIALLAFVALVGPGASVIRAAAMAVVLLLGLSRGRAADGVPALGLALVVLLINDPWLARDYGFALSVLATAGLLVLAGPMSRVFARWMPRSLAIALAVPTAAQLACQPVLLLLTPTLPLFGVPANLLAEPAAPLATVLGCVACAVLPWAPAAGEFIVWLAWAPSAWIAQVATFASVLPGVALPWAPGLLGVVLSVVVLVAVAVLLLARRAPRVVSTAAIVALCFGAVVYAGALGGSAVGRAVAIPTDWQIAACDVGQGDGLLLRDGDSVAMIDVGREAEPAAACLDRLGIGELDLLVLTHFDADHVGGIAAVAERATRAVVQRPVREADERTLAVLEAAGVALERGHAGVSGRLGALSWRLLWPQEGPGGGAGDTSATTEDTGNAGSLTLEAEGRGMRSIFLGDLGEESQDALLATRAVRPVDVVKVAHHGSGDQSAALYAALGASLGLVSVGARNGYGHPTRRALDLLADSGTTIARTDESGLLLVSPGPSRVQLWSEHAATQAAAQAATRSATKTAGGRPYPGYAGPEHDGSGHRRGDPWRPEAAVEPAQASRVPRARSRRCRGTRSGRRRWSSSRVPKDSSPIGRCAPFGTRSRATIRASRSATCTPATTRRGNCSPLRAPPCSVSRG